MFKTITVKKRGGGTREQKVEVLPSGKYKFVKNSGIVKENPKKKSVVKKTTSKKSRRKQTFTLPIAPILGLAAGLIDPVVIATRDKNPQAAFNIACKRYTGYDPNNGTWNYQDMSKGVVPLAVGLLVHKFVGGSPLNLNRTLAKAGVPLLRI